MASLTDEQQSKGNLGGPDLFLAPIGRLPSELVSKYFCNTCEKEMEGCPGGEAASVICVYFMHKNPVPLLVQHHLPLGFYNSDGILNGWNHIHHRNIFHVRLELDSLQLPRLDFHIQFQDIPPSLFHKYCKNILKPTRLEVCQWEPKTNLDLQDYPYFVAHQSVMP